MKLVAKFALVLSLILCAGNAAAQSVEKEPVAVIELGTAGFWNIKDGTSSFGPSVAVEVTPIENWLELEAGTTPLFKRHSTEWGTDLLFKKPWHLSKKVELMLGAGPEWVHAKQYGITMNSVSVEATADFMFWGQRNTSSAVMSNPRTNTTLDVDASNHSASPVGSLSRSHSILVH